MTQGGDKAVFLAVVWEKARMFEKDIRADIAARFNLLAETECFWPACDFTKKLADFYGWQDRFCWWNKARKCGRGAFKVFVFEVENPHYERCRNPFGREVLVETRVNDAKRVWRHMTGHHNRVHASLNADETELESKALWGKTVREWLAGRAGMRVPFADELESLDTGGTLLRLGIGSRRACYALPGTELCLKGYRSEEEIALGKHVEGRPFKPLAPAVIREIRRNRFSDEGNTSCQEWCYYNALHDSLPAELMAIFPEFLERVLLPSRGWCLVENMIRNADGSPVKKFHVAYRAIADGSVRAEMLSRLRGLEDELVRYGVRFYDPQNVMVQWLANGAFRLRIIDFEPASRTMVSPDNWCTALVRLKVRRRFARYRRLVKC